MHVFVTRAAVVALLAILSACARDGSTHETDEPTPLPRFGGVEGGVQLNPDTLPTDLATLPPDPEPPVVYDAVPYADSAAATTAAAPDPGRGMIVEWLMGQRVRAYRRLFDSVWWTIEPGEISDLSSVPRGLDPEGRSWLVDLDFRVQAGGKGLRIQGVLRHYGDGSEGNGFGFRDFTPTRVERFGTW